MSPGVKPGSASSGRSSENPVLPIPLEQMEKFNRNPDAFSKFVAIVKVSAGVSLLWIGLCVLILTGPSGAGVLVGLILMGAGYFLTPEDLDEAPGSLDPTAEIIYQVPQEFQYYSEILADGYSNYLDEPFVLKTPVPIDLDKFEYPIPNKISAPNSTDEARQALEKIRPDLITVPCPSTEGDQPQHDSSPCG